MRCCLVLNGSVSYLYILVTLMTASLCFQSPFQWGHLAEGNVPRYPVFELSVHLSGLWLYFPECTGSCLKSLMFERKSIFPPSYNTRLTSSQHKLCDASPSAQISLSHLPVHFSMWKTFTPSRDWLPKCSVSHRPWITNGQHLLHLRHYSRICVMSV